MAESDDLIEQGIAQARSGQREAAYATLRRSLYAEGDSTNLRVWLAATSPSLAEAQTHLERALELEPDNAQARNGLRWVAQQLAAGVTAPPPAPAPATLRRPPLAPPSPIVAPSAEAAPAAAPTLQPVAVAAASAPSRPMLDASETPSTEVVICANCGSEARPGDRYCLRCGRPLMTHAEEVRVWRP